MSDRPENRIEQFFETSDPKTIPETANESGPEIMFKGLIAMGERLGVVLFTPSSFPDLRDIQEESDSNKKLEFIAQGAEEWARQLSTLAAACRAEKTNT